MTIHVSHIQINNILGIQSLEFTPGAFNVIKGPNGVGKTSLLEAIKTTIKAEGYDATLIRKGEDKGEVVLVLDNGATLRKRVTASGQSLDMLTPENQKTARPQDAIRRLVDMLSVNPVDFLRATKKDRARVLLEAMPLVADAERLQQISGLPVTIEEGMHAIQAIQQVHKEVYDLRTGTNRALKEKEATTNQMRNALPEAPGGVHGSEDELRAELARVEGKGVETLNKINSQESKMIAELSAKKQALRDELQAAIDKLKERASADAAAIDAEIKDIETRAQAARDKTADDAGKNAIPIREALAVIVANRDAAARREQALVTIRQMEKDIDDLSEDSKRQTKSLEELEAYKLELLSGLPVPGLEIIDGEVYRDGILFDRLNTAQQVDIAVEIAKLRSGELGVMCVDGLELLSSDAFDAFRERALESGLQLFVTRVTDDETLSIETE